MTFQQLKYLLEIYRTGSITKAAQNLYLAQSSLSIAISNLEQELNCHIFTRSKNGMTPTPEGLQIIERASKIYGEYELMTQLPQAVCRRVHFNGSNLEPTMNAYLRLIEENKDRKDVTFSITSYSTDEAMARVALEETDVSVLLYHEPRILEMETRVHAKGLTYKIYGKTPAVATIGPGHRLYNQENIDYRELESDLLVDTVQGSQLYNHHMKGIMQLNPDRTIMVGNKDIRRMLIEKGLAYSIGIKVSQDVTDRYKFRYVPLGDLNFLLLAITNPARILPPEAQRFLELLEEESKTLDCV